MADKIEVKVPDIGDFDEVEVIDVLVSEGDEVEEEQGLITLETDKAAMDVPAPQAGKIASLKVKAGDKVSEGTVIAVMEAADAGEDDGDEPPEETQEAASNKEKDEGEAQEADAEEAADEEGAGESREVEVTVPDIGDFDKVEVIEVLVREGDEVDEEQGIVTLESDKATMDVAARRAVELARG
jgi:pyruvate/2-oxoglutarate dehydrogenase complex dihydrolipoamide acyltransferase (E2) component